MLEIKGINCVIIARAMSTKTVGTLSMSTRLAIVGRTSCKLKSSFFLLNVLNHSWLVSE